MGDDEAKNGQPKPRPIRRYLAVGIAITATFSAGVVSGLLVDHRASVQPVLTTTATASTADADAERREQSRDRVVDVLRNSRTRTGITLTAACRDPHAVVADDRAGSQKHDAPAADLAFDDVELFNMALHKYMPAADQFPAISYRQIGLYTKAGARLSYFIDGKGKVQRDPVLDPPNAVFGLDWCRSLSDFNAA